MWLVNAVICAGTVFLLLFGEYIAARFFNRQEGPK